MIRYDIYKFIVVLVGAVEMFISHSNRFTQAFLRPHRPVAKFRTPVETFSTSDFSVDKVEIGGVEVEEK